MPVQPIASPRRAQARANFGAASGAWSALTSAQQAAWETYAQSYPRTDSLGQSIVLTGHMMFVAISAALLNIGQAISPTPPISNMTSPITGLVTWANDGVGIGCRFDPPGLNQYFAVAASRPQSAGVSFVSTWRQFNSAGNSANLNFFDITADYVAAFGIPLAGQRIFFKLTPVNINGVTGTPAKVITTVVSNAVIPSAVLTSGGAGTVTATWAGGASYQVLWTYVNGAPPSRSWAEYDASAPSPITSGALTVGTSVTARLFDGVTVGPESAPFIVI